MTVLSEKNALWRRRTALIFWGAVVLAFFSFVSAAFGGTGVMLLITNGLSALIENHASFGNSIDNFEDKATFVIAVCGICQIMALVGWIVYIIGLYKFRGLAHSESSYSNLGRIITGCWIEIAAFATMLLVPVVFAVLLKEASYNEDNMVKYVALLVVASWIMSIVAYSIFMVNFKRLSTETTWSERACFGAAQLKDSAKYNIWILVIPVIAVVVLILTAIAHMDSIKSLIDRSWENPYGALNAIDRLKTINDNYKIVYYFETICAFIPFILLALMQLVFKLLGWHKVMTGGYLVSKAKISQECRSQSGARYCHKCGGLLPDDSAFCPKCGTAVETIASDAAEDNEQATDMSDAVTDKREGYTSNYQGNDDDDKPWKVWLKWGGITAAVVAVVIAVWAIWFNGGNAVEGNLYVDSATVFRTFDGDLGEDPLADLQYGDAVAFYEDEDEKEEKRKWVKVKGDKDGKKFEGFVESNSVMPREDFTKVDKAGLNNETVRFYADLPVFRRAIADALSAKDEGWVLEVFEDGANPVSLNYITEYIEGVSPYPLCFGFVVRSTKSDDREMFLYSVDEDGGFSLVHNENVVTGSGKIERLRFNKGIFTVIYDERSRVALDPSDKKEMEGTKDFLLLQGEIDGQYPIRMDIKLEDDGTVRGDYRYLKNDVPISISGTYTEEEGGRKSMSIEETVKGNITGNFIGTFDGETFSGSWISADGEKEMPFSLTVCIFE